MAGASRIWRCRAVEKLRVSRGAICGDAARDRGARAAARSRRRGGGPLARSCSTRARSTRCSSSCKPEHFYSEAHRRIFEACVELRADGQPVDIVQVAHVAARPRAPRAGRRHGVPDARSSTRRPPSRTSPRTAQTIHEKWRIRQLILDVPARRRAGLRRLRRGAGVHRQRRAGRSTSIARTSRVAERREARSTS